MDAAKAFLEPSSVTVIADAWEPGTQGARLVDNLLAAGWQEAAPPEAVAVSMGRDFHAPSLPCAPAVPELALICLPPQSAPQGLQEVGQRGVRAAVILAHDPDGEAPDTPFKQALHQAARVHGVRWMGPGSAGVQRPHRHLNASRISRLAVPGPIALISQSSSLAAGTLAWAQERGIGFSSVMTVGAASDMAIGDVIDLIAADPRTRVVLLVLGSVRNGRRFMSSVRALSRLKPVIVLWTGTNRQTRSAEFDMDHGAVCRAAFERAGLLRVSGLVEWFDAVSVLSGPRRLAGDRLVVVANGLGSARLLDSELGALQPLERLPVAMDLPPGRTRTDPQANPIDLGDEADPDAWRDVLEQIRAQRASDAVIAVVAPTRPGSAEAVAEAIVTASRDAGFVVLVCWMDGSLTAAIRDRFAAAGMVVFDAPERAAQAWRSLVRFRRTQAALNTLPQTQRVAGTPHATSLGLTEDEESPALLAAFGTVSAAILQHREALDAAQSSSVLAAFGLSRPAGARARPGARLPLHVRIGHDASFGRVITASVGSRRHLLLPALNRELAARAAADLRAELALLGHDEVSAEHLGEVLVRVSDALVALPELVGGHLDDFALGGDGLVAMTGRLKVRAWDRAEPHLAVQPYPASTESLITLRNGHQALIRPLRPAQDLPWLQALIEAVSADDRFMRFARVLHDPTLELARMLRIDYDREMLFIALGTQSDGSTHALGVVEAQILPDGRRAEFSILLRSDQKGTGLGHQLMNKIIDYARQRELRELFGEVLKGNRPMRGLATRLGFQTRADIDDDLVTVSLDLSRHDPEFKPEPPRENRPR